jgi:hypothetical protein
VVADGHVFIRDWTTSARIVSADTGAVQGPMDSTTAPAVANGIAYELNGSVLQAVADDGLGDVIWSFPGDGALDTAPVVTGSTVWVGSSQGNLYSLDGVSGEQLSVTDAGGEIPGPSNSSDQRGLSAGGGGLLVPVGSTLVDYSASDTSTGVPVSTTGTPPGSAKKQAPEPAGPRTTSHAVLQAEQARLRREIALRVTIRRLLANRGASLHVDAPGAGRVEVSWYFAPAGHRAAVAIAAGKLTARHPGRRSLRLRLTRQGRSLLRGSRRGLTALAYGEFAPRQGPSLVAHRTFRLRSATRRADRRR